MVSELMKLNVNTDVDKFRIETFPEYEGLINIFINEKFSLSLNFEKLLPFPIVGNEEDNFYRISYTYACKDVYIENIILEDSIQEIIVERKGNILNVEIRYREKIIEEMGNADIEEIKSKDKVLGFIEHDEKVVFGDNTFEIKFVSEDVSIIDILENIFLYIEQERYDELIEYVERLV